MEQNLLNMLNGTMRPGHQNWESKGKGAACVVAFPVVNEPGFWGFRGFDFSIHPTVQTHGRDGLPLSDPIVHAWWIDLYVEHEAFGRFSPDKSTEEAVFGNDDFFQAARPATMAGVERTTRKFSSAEDAVSAARNAIRHIYRRLDRSGEEHQPTRAEFDNMVRLLEGRLGVKVTGYNPGFQVRGPNGGTAEVPYWLAQRIVAPGAN